MSCIIFSEKFHNNIRSKLYLRPKLNMMQFGIQHFAGKVVYSVEGFLDKNRQYLPIDVIKLLCGSSNQTVRRLFQLSFSRHGNTFCSMPVNLHPLQTESCNKVMNSFPLTENQAQINKLDLGGVMM